MISHHLDLHVSNNKQYWAFFMCLLAICMSSLEKMSIQIFCPFFKLVFFFFWILSCVSCLYILDTNSSSTISFTNIFSHSVDCLFILFMVSFAVQKVLGLIRSHLFVFISITLGDRSKKIIVMIYVRVFCQDVVHITQWNIIQSLNE